MSLLPASHVTGACGKRSRLGGGVGARVGLLAARMAALCSRVACDVRTAFFDKSFMDGQGANGNFGDRTALCSVGDAFFFLALGLLCGAKVGVSDTAVSALAGVLIGSGTIAVGVSVGAGVLIRSVGLPMYGLTRCLNTAFAILLLELAAG